MTAARPDLLDAPMAQHFRTAEQVWAVLPAAYLDGYLQAMRGHDPDAERGAAEGTLLLAMSCVLEAFPVATVRQAAAWAWVSLLAPEMIFPHQLGPWAQAFGDRAGSYWPWAAAGLTPQEAARTDRAQAELLARLRTPLPPL